MRGGAVDTLRDVPGTAEDIGGTWSRQSGLLFSTQVGTAACRPKRSRMRAPPDSAATHRQEGHKAVSTVSAGRTSADVPTYGTSRDARALSAPYRASVDSISADSSLNTACC